MKRTLVILLILLGSLAFAQANIRYAAFAMEGIEVHRMVTWNVISNENVDTTYIQSPISWSTYPLQQTVTDDTIKLDYDFMLYFKLVFCTDTSCMRYTKYKAGGSPEYEDGFGLINAPLINTDSTYVIDLDSATLEACDFYYYSVRASHHSGGRTRTETISSTGNYTGNSKVTVRFFKYPLASVSVLTDPDKLVVYPNPANDRVIVSSPRQTLGPVIIYDMLGRTRMKAVPTSSGELDLSALSSGVYVLSLGGHLSRIIVQ